MAALARIIAKELRSAGLVPADTLRRLVEDCARAEAEAVNDAGVEAQLAFLLKAYGPDELRARCGLPARAVA